MDESAHLPTKGRTYSDSSMNSEAKDGDVEIVVKDTVDSTIDASTGSNWTDQVRTALRCGQPNVAATQQRTLLWAIALLLLVAVGVAAISLMFVFGAFDTTTKTRPTSLIFVITDGFSPASATFARTLHSYRKEFGLDNHLKRDSFHEHMYEPFGEAKRREKRATGNSKYNWNHVDLIDQLEIDPFISRTVRTYSSSSTITDSAAGATAYSCSNKTYNGAIAVLHDGQYYKACGTFMEAAKAQGYRTALVATSRITHATPASFSSHVSYRDWEEEIARQQARTQSVDILFGGGLSLFSQDNGTIDLLQEMEGRGYQSITNLSEFRYEDLHMPIIGLFAPSHMDYEIDRIHEDPITQPSLAEMVNKALELLSEQDDPFVMMVEASRIDMAAHKHDPAAHFSDIMAYNEAVKVILGYVEENPDTVAVATSDHATGGITIGRNFRNDTYPPYVWYPHVVNQIQASCEKMAKIILDGGDIRNTLEEWTNMNITDEEVAWIEAAMNQPNDTYRLVAESIGDMESYAAFIGWTTSGHTGEDVNFYSFGKELPMTKGVRDNIQVGQAVIDMFGFDVVSITQSLSTMPIEPPPPGEGPPGTDDRKRRDTQQHMPRRDRHYQYAVHD